MIDNPAAAWLLTTLALVALWYAEQAAALLWQLP